jgi:hypothetical protein
LPVWFDDQLARHTFDQRPVRRQFAAIELQVDVPPERRNAGRDGLQRLPWQRPARVRNHHETHAAHAGRVQALQLGVGRIGGDDADAARIRAELLQ